MKQKTTAPRYEKPPADPFERRLERRFSIHPKVVDAVQSFEQRVKSAGGGRISPQDYNDVLEPFVLRRKLGETNDVYKERALQSGLMTDVEVEWLVRKRLGYVGTEETKDKVVEHDRVLDEIRESKAGEPYGREVTMTPFLVNVSWSYQGSFSPKGGSRSPPVKYSIEGIFYGEDMETTMEAAREFIMDRIADSSSYKAKAVMDVADMDADIKVASDVDLGAMEVSGEPLQKASGEDMSDEKFETKFTAFFQNPESRRVYVDRDFGYSNSVVRYRWTANGTKIVAD